MLSYGCMILLFYLTLIIVLRVWHFCLKTYADKLEKPNELALRSVFQDKENDYRYLLNKTDKTTLYNQRSRILL